MISVITTTGFNHNSFVEDEVDRLQKNGHEVTVVTRMEKMLLGIAGEDVTHIHYKITRVRD